MADFERLAAKESALHDQFVKASRRDADDDHDQGKPPGRVALDPAARSEINRQVRTEDTGQPEHHAVGVDWPADEGDLEEQEVSSYFDLNLNSETSRYVFRILAMKIIFENKKAYGYDEENMDLYEPIKTRSITINRPINDVKKWAKDQGSNYRMLKLLNPWIIGNKLTYKNSALIIELPV